MEIYHHIHCSGHGHHNHVPATINNIILFCVVLNLVFVIFEAIMGVVYNSVGLLSDAGHNMSDVYVLLKYMVMPILLMVTKKRQFLYPY